MADPQHIVAATALVTNTADEVLMVRHPRRGWEFPGGQVEVGEDLITALEREISEESGIRVEVGALAGVYSNIVPPSKVIFAFMAQATGGALTTSVESVEVGWVAREDVLARVDHPAIHERARDLLAFEGQVIYRAYAHPPYAVHVSRSM